jgi:shikimate dehydrogenase
MAPAIEVFPDIPYAAITYKHLLIDLIYNPSETAFLKKGHEMGAKTLNGHKMFIEQAEENWRIWND